MALLFLLLRRWRGMPMSRPWIACSRRMPGPRRGSIGRLPPIRDLRWPISGARGACSYRRGLRRRGKRRGALARWWRGARRGSAGMSRRSPSRWRGMRCARSPRSPSTSSSFRATRWCSRPPRACTGCFGFSGRQDRNEALAALLDPLAGAYGEDWWFLGAHGFALTEARGWAAGAPLVERSLALSPRNAHGAHAWAHVLYERGDERDGARLRRRVAARLSARGPAPLPSVVAPGALRAGARPARPRVGDLPREHPAGRGAVAGDARRWPTVRRCSGAASWRGRSIAPITGRKSPRSPRARSRRSGSASRTRTARSPTRRRASGRPSSAGSPS